MIIIAHRGLLEGPDQSLENKPEQIDAAIDLGFDVEVDIHYIDGKYFLGHDEPQYGIQLDWLLSRKDNLWVHCKNIASLLKLKKTSLNYFWHENDTVALTSRCFVWAYPGKQPIKNSIAVLPELNNDPTGECFGICTDYSIKYRKELRR
jgi:hypothetical protein